MKKLRILSILAALTLIFTFVSCKEKPAEETTAVTTETPETTALETTAPETTAPAETEITSRFMGKTATDIDVIIAEKIEQSPSYTGSLNLDITYTMSLFGTTTSTTTSMPISFDIVIENLESSSLEDLSMRATISGEVPLTITLVDNVMYYTSESGNYKVPFDETELVSIPQSSEENFMISEFFSDVTVELNDDGSVTLIGKGLSAEYFGDMIKSSFMGDLEGLEELLGDEYGAYVAAYEEAINSMMENAEVMYTVNEEGLLSYISAKASIDIEGQLIAFNATLTLEEADVEITLPEGDESYMTYEEYMESLLSFDMGDEDIDWGDIDWDEEDIDLGDLDPDDLD